MAARHAALSLFRCLGFSRRAPSKARGPASALCRLGRQIRPGRGICKVRRPSLRGYISELRVLVVIAHCCVIEFWARLIGGGGPGDSACIAQHADSELGSR